MLEAEQAIEIAGEDVETAIAKGLARLGIDRDAVEIELLDQGSRGVFGLGAREARVRLTPKPKEEPPCEDAGTGPSAELPTAPAGAAEPTPFEFEKDEAELARSVLLELLDLLGMENAQVDARQTKPAEGEEESPLLLDVHGPGTDALIGRRGETIAALQYITRLIAGREMSSRVWLVLDVGGFKARREKTLRRLAHRMAEQALHSHRTEVLEPMPPHERRIIHLALRDHPSVITKSVGEGDRRKVTIIPQ